MENKKIKIFIIFIIAIFFIFLSVPEFMKKGELIIEKNQNELTTTNFEYENLENKEIKVYISGEILKPDIYEVSETLRVIDVIELAGGTTENADLSKINLSEYVYDTQHIYIPNFNENEISVIDENYDIIVEETGVKVNLNLATKEELMSVKYIGEVKANKIIEYREENGEFGDVAELKNISGIGEKTFEKIKNSFYVE